MKPTPFLLFFATFLIVALLAGPPLLARADSSVPSSSPTLSPDAPPPGLTPSTSTVDAVMAAWRTAEGKFRVKVATEIEVDEIAAYGLTGSDRTVTAGDNFRDTFTLGPVT